MALDFLAGCLGGCAGVIVGHPFDTIKIHIQTQNFNKPKYLGAMDCFRKILAKEGLRGIYKGMSSPLMGAMAINAIVFGVYGNTQKQLYPDSLYSHFVSGAIAGFSQSFLTSPLELVKSRMQVSIGTKKGALDFLALTYKKDGAKGIFRGLGITIVREIPAFGTYFLTYEFLTKSNNTQAATMLIAGGVAGTISWFITYPIDVIKSRVQIDDLERYKNSLDCLRKSLSREGYKFLYRGITPAIIRAFPVNAATFAVVTWTLRLFEDHNIPERVTDGEILWERYTDAVYSLKMSEAAV